MKTSLLLTFAAVAMTAITLKVSAYDVARSPRAAANEIKVVKTADAVAPVAVVAYNAPSSTLLSPRAAANQIKVVKSTEPAKAVLVTQCQAIGSPKYQSQMGNSARTRCCGMTLSQCPTSDVCQK
jgi:hypothetical protein